MLLQAFSSYLFSYVYNGNKMHIKRATQTHYNVPYNNR